MRPLPPSPSTNVSVRSTPAAELQQACPRKGRFVRPHTPPLTGAAQKPAVFSARYGRLLGEKLVRPAGTAARCYYQGP